MRAKPKRQSSSNNHRNLRETQNENQNVSGRKEKLRQSSRNKHFWASSLWNSYTWEMMRNLFRKLQAGSTWLLQKTSFTNLFKLDWVSVSYQDWAQSIWLFSEHLIVLRVNWLSVQSLVTHLENRSCCYRSQLLVWMTQCVGHVAGSDLILTTRWRWRLTSAICISSWSDMPSTSRQPWLIKW